MKKYIIGHCSACAVLFFLGFILFACDSNQSESMGVGKMRLSLFADTTSLRKGVDNMTKATIADEFESFLSTDDYRVFLLQGTDTLQSYIRFDEMPSEIELKEGVYPHRLQRRQSPFCL